jgi:hypothetical protein
MKLEQQQNPITTSVATIRTPHCAFHLCITSSALAIKTMSD